MPKATGGIAIVAIIADHLLPLVWDMRCHSRKPIEGIKDLFHLSVFGLVEDSGFLGKIGHPLLGEGGPDNISGQIFCGILLSG